MTEDQAVPGKWLKAKTDIAQRGYAVRPGWHVLTSPEAPHLTRKGRVMKLVEFRGILHVESRPLSQGGTWLTVKQIRILEGEVSNVQGG